MSQGLPLFCFCTFANPSLHCFTPTSPTILAGAGLDLGGAGVAPSTDSHKYQASALRRIKYLNHDINDTLSTISVIIHQRETGCRKHLDIFGVLQSCFISFNSTVKCSRAMFMTDTVVLRSHFTPSQAFCYMSRCPNKGCKQRSQLSDLIVGQEPSSAQHFACSE